MIDTVTAQTSVEQIETTERHYEAFAFKHPAEADAVFQVGDLRIGYDRREIFEWTTDEFGELFVDVTGIKRALAARQMPFNMYRLDLTQEWVDLCLIRNGCEESRLAALTPSDLRRPGIMLMIRPPETVAMIDGNHRAVARWRKGLRTFTFANVMLPDAIDYIAQRDGIAKFIDRERRIRQ